MTFNETGLSPNILQAISEMGFETPTPVQREVIPVILNDPGDIVALAQTGTGKTAAFGLPLIQLIDTESASLQGLVLCPTRELCLQIHRDLTAFSKYIERLSVAAVYGGADIRPQIREVKKARIVVGTPGRTLDLIRQRVLKLGNIKRLVLDEADEMLNRGFKEELDAILETAPPLRQTLLFSATMPQAIASIASTYMNDYKEIRLGAKNAPAKDISHLYYVVSQQDRYPLLRRIADFNPDIYGIIFCRTRAETREVADNLIRDGYNAEALHGDLSQTQRDYVMNRFRIRHVQLLVATDVAARGLDVRDLTQVINYHLPDDPEVYLHRSGRTGRAGKKGVSVSIITPKELYRIRNLEKFLNGKIKKVHPPTGTEICEKQLFFLMAKITGQPVDREQIAPFLPAIYQQFAELDREELIQRIVSLEFDRFLSYYAAIQDLHDPFERKKSISKAKAIPEKSKRPIPVEKKERRNDPGRVVLSLDAGMRDGITPNKLHEFIQNLFGEKEILAHDIRIKKQKTTFAFPQEKVRKLQTMCRGIGYSVKQAGKYYPTGSTSRNRPHKPRRNTRRE